MSGGLLILKDDSVETGAKQPTQEQQQHQNVDTEGTSRRKILQRIQQRKQKVFNLPIAQKLAKLSMYSACQAEDGCRCTGWKTPQENRHRDVENTYCPDFSEECRNPHCRHPLERHISHLDGISSRQMNELLGAIIDMENLFTSMQRVEDEDTKKVYQNLFRLLLQRVITRQHAVIRGPFGDPPFESPSIAKAVSSFVFYKYNHLSQTELQTMTEVAKTFLNFLNHYNFEPPSMRRADLSHEDASTYKINYTRWLVFCHVPAFCNSLRHFETSLVFGRSLLRTVFLYMAQQLKKKCVSERDRFPVDKRSIITQMPKFLEALKAEILKDDSPIWDPTYRPPVPLVMQHRKRQQESASSRNSTGKRNNTAEPSNKRFKKETNDCKVEEQKRVVEIQFRKDTDPVDAQTLLRSHEELQLVFTDQLFIIPQECVTQLDFDTKHTAFALKSYNGNETQTIGGIRFCTLPSRDFTEVDCLVVKMSEHLMNYLKDYSYQHDIIYILTYVDCNEIGYFKAQGLSKDIKLARPMYAEYTKQYDGATLIHCELHPSIVNIHHINDIRKQSETLKTAIAQRHHEMQKILKCGLTCFKDGVRSIPVELIPSIRQLDWKSQVRTQRSFQPDESSDPEKLITSFVAVLQSVKQHSLSWVFVRPLARLL